jgi:hypothetical protein
MEPHSTASSPLARTRRVAARSGVAIHDRGTVYVLMDGTMFVADPFDVALKNLLRGRTAVASEKKLAP